MTIETPASAAVQISEQLAQLRFKLKKVQEEFEQRKAMWLEQRWYDHATAITERLIRMGHRRVEKLRSKSAALESTLTHWMEQLRDGQKDLSNFQVKQDSYGKPLLVSHARKLPHQQFIETQTGIEQEARAYLGKLQGTLVLLNKRATRVLSALVLSAEPLSMDVATKKVAMESDLRELLGCLPPIAEKLREQSQRLEEAQTQVAALREGVNGMICVEDMPRPKKGIDAGAWIKILQRMLPRKALPR